MERKTFRFENEDYRLARMQPWWCYKDGGADGGDVGPGTGKNEGNPGRGNRGGTSSGVSAGPGAAQAGPSGRGGRSLGAIGAAATGGGRQGANAVSTPTRTSTDIDMPSTTRNAPASAPAPAASSGGGKAAAAEPAPAPASAPASEANSTTPGPVDRSRTSITEKAAAINEEARAALVDDEGKKVKKTTGSLSSIGLLGVIANIAQQKTSPVNLSTKAIQTALDTEPSALANLMGLTEESRAANIQGGMNIDAGLNFAGQDEGNRGGGERNMETTATTDGTSNPGDSTGTTTPVTTDTSGYPTAPPVGGGSGSSGSGTTLTTPDGDTITAADYDSLLDGIVKEIADGPVIEDMAADMYGLEDTRLSRRLLSDPNLRRMYLTMAGARRFGNGQQVVDPFTGTRYANPEAARSSGITNWVYSYVYDSKRSGANTYGRRSLYSMVAR